MNAEFLRIHPAALEEAEVAVDWYATRSRRGGLDVSGWADQNGGWETKKMASKIVPSDLTRMIERLYPWAPQAPATIAWNLGPGETQDLSVIIGLAELIPMEMITVAGEEYAAYIVALGEAKRMLRQRVEWDNDSQRRTANFRIGGLMAFGGRQALTILHAVLSKCPDEIPGSEAQELSFISEIDVREGLRLDISAVHDAIATSNWKAATVLGGAVVEALLLWAIQASNSDWNAATFKGKGDILRWDLTDLINVATEFKIIGENTPAQASLSRNARNLVHPGKMLRERAECHRGTAFAAAAAIDQVVRDLEVLRRRPE